MGLLSKLFGGGNDYELPESGDVDVALYDGNRDFSQEVVGESHYQEQLLQALEDHGRDYACEIWVVLQPQPDNQYDQNAVAVVASTGVVGHLSRDDARQWQKPIMAAWNHEGKPIAVKAKIHRGGEEHQGSCGIWLDWPDNFEN